MPAPTQPEMSKLADAVAADLRRGVYNQTVIVNRKWDTDVKISELDICLITVSAKGETSGLNARDSLAITTPISIAVRKKLDFAKSEAEREADIDALAAILQQVTYFHACNTPTGRNEQWTGSEMLVLFPLNEARQIDAFMGACEITFETDCEITPPEMTP